MEFSIDHQSSVPPFEQLRSQIVAAVSRGLLISGTRIPTVRNMALLVGIAPNTVAKTYRELEQDGVIETKGRSGSFIAAVGDPARTSAQRAANEYVRLTHRLGVPADDAVEFVRSALTTIADD